MQEKQRIKKEKRDKYERWVKTQSMFYHKTSTNYQKWEYFVTDSDSEEEKEPILPENDP